MKRVAIIIELIILFLILTQTIVFPFHLINQPDTISLISGVILFGVQIFGIIVLINYTYKLIVGWDKKPEIVSEEIQTETLKKKKKRNYYKPKKKSDFPIGSIEKKEKQTNLKPKKDE